jgi:hypothetical protein
VVAVELLVVQAVVHHKLAAMAVLEWLSFLYLQANILEQLLVAQP